MQLSNIPGKLVLPFANAGGKSTIPVASQIGITAGAASLTDGFPPLTRTPIAAGGVPPSGLDMNGILYEMSAIIRWANAGGGYPYDGTFATDTNVGGYPKGARIMRTDGTGYWFNTVENNVTDPESAGAVAAGWVPDFTTGAATVSMASSSVTLSPSQYGKPLIVITGTLTANLTLFFPNIVGNWAILNGTTGNFTITAKTAAGSGVTLGTISQIVGDGTNIYVTNPDSVQVVTNVAKLRNIAPSLSRRMQTSGYYVVGDNGSGQFYAEVGVAPGTYVDNGGSIIVPNGGDGSAAWLLDITYGVNVRQFGAKGDSTSDDTASIHAAQQASKYVYCPPGNYSVAGLRIYDQVNLIGAGYENTRFLQRDPGQPAINCLSDATVGQLLSLRLENFGVTGHPTATVEAVRIVALGVYAIYRSHFDMIISSCYQGLNMQADSANNVFYCTFRMDIVGTQTTSAVLNGGTYNTFDFFIAQVGNGRMIEHQGFNDTFTRLVGEGQIYSNGQNTIFISPTIEELPNSPPSPYGIILNGFNQTLILPTIILGAASSAKITHCIKPFASSLIINPRFIVNGVLHPFEGSAETWTLQGPGQNECVNKMEMVYDGTNNATDLRLVDKVGDVSSFLSSTSGTFSGKSVQYQTYSAGAFVNHRIFNCTDAMIYDLGGTATLINVTLGYAGIVRKQGQTLSIYFSAPVTTVTWSGNGSDTSLFPTSITSATTINMMYDSGTNKWWPV